MIAISFWHLTVVDTLLIHILLIPKMYKGWIPNPVGHLTYSIAFDTLFQKPYPVFFVFVTQTVEKFFSKEIKYLVSNKREAKYVQCLRQNSPVPSPDSGQSSPHPRSNPHQPGSHRDNVKSRARDQTDTVSSLSLFHQPYCRNVFRSISGIPLLIKWCRLIVNVRFSFSVAVLQFVTSRGKSLVERVVKEQVCYVNTIKFSKEL